MTVSLGLFKNNNASRRCIVVGDIILDKYIYGHVDRISPEAPIPVVSTKNMRYVLGGAANVAGNIRGLGLEVALCGIVGSDSEADVLTGELQKKNIGFMGVKSADRCTTLKTRIVGMNQQLVRVDREDSQPMSNDEENNLIKKLEDLISPLDIVILSDYNKGVCKDSFCRWLSEKCRKDNIKMIVDPKSSNWKKYSGAYLITPNFKEFQEAIGFSIPNEEGCISENAGSLLNKYNLNRILVTRSHYGMTLIQRDLEPLTFKAKQQEVFDVSGAGDTVIATLAAALSVGYELKDAVEISNIAAGVAVSKAGTYDVSLTDLLEYTNETNAWYEDKIVSKNEINGLVTEWKKSGETVVFTNGCFDVIHIGHLDYLNKARRLGNRLVVGLNSDDSVKRLKGEKRPLNKQHDRACMLAALQCVDAVVVFEEDTPEKLISVICPDYLVKGGDYKIEEIVGREYAGEVMTIPFLEGYSTTSIIEKIKSM